jgi:hypothetical protein
VAANDIERFESARFGGDSDVNERLGFLRDAIQLDDRQMLPALEVALVQGELGTSTAMDRLSRGRARRSSRPTSVGAGPVAVNRRADLL